MAIIRKISLLWVVQDFVHQPLGEKHVGRGPGSAQYLADLLRFVLVVLVVAVVLVVLVVLVVVLVMVLMKPYDGFVVVFFDCLGHLRWQNRGSIARSPRPLISWIPTCSRVCNLLVEKFRDRCRPCSS